MEKFARPRPRGRTAPAVSYVVRPRRGGRGLVATLASLAYETTEQDEVLILAAPGEVRREAETLAANLGTARFVSAVGSAGGWLNEVRRDVVCYLHEGDRLSEGATAAALNAFAEHPEVEAVVGHVLGTDRRGRPTHVRYRPPQPYRAESGTPAPPAAVFWKCAVAAGACAAPWAARVGRIDSCTSAANAPMLSAARSPASRRRGRWCGRSPAPWPGGCRAGCKSY